MESPEAKMTQEEVNRYFARALRVERKRPTWSDWVVGVVFILGIASLIFGAGQQSMCQYVPERIEKCAPTDPYEWNP